MMNKEQLAPIYLPLDKGIKDSVDLLRSKGINTRASCDGHHNGRNELAWIAADLDLDQTPDAGREKIAKILVDAGHSGFTINEEFLYQRTTDPWKIQLRITFWSWEPGS